MKQEVITNTWVVYRMTLSSNLTGGNVVCEQREWDQIERIRPGFHLLIRSGIATEQEAEKLARGTAGDRPLKKGGPRANASVNEMLNVPPAVTN